MKTKLAFLYFLLVIVLIAGLYTTVTLYFQNSVLTDFEDEIYEYDTIQDEMVSVSFPFEIEKSGIAADRIYVPQIALNVSELQATNKDFQGWLFIPDSPISYPVVSTDDNNYYLTHSLTGYETAYGCLFLDVYSTTDASSRVIHGHNMGTGHDKMFSMLVHYQEQSYADAHSLICFAELDGITDGYQVFAVVNFDTDLEEFDYRKANFESEEEYQSFVAYMQSHSVYETEFVPKSTDLLILSTCNREFGSSNRLLVCAAKISTAENDNAETQITSSYR